MEISRTGIGGLLYVEFKVNIDPEREGCSFTETFRLGEIAVVAGIDIDGPVQGNRAVSTAGTTRGFHIAPWWKYVWVEVGEAFAAIGDPRPDSPTVGKVETFRLDGTNALFVSSGLANAYQAQEDGTRYLYQVSEYWSPGQETGIRYNDPTFAADWPITDDRLQTKEADRISPTLQEVLG